MAKVDPAPGFPSNDVLLHEVLATLRDHPGGVDEDALDREISVRTHHEHLLAEDGKGRKVLSGGVSFCLQILAREQLAMQANDRWRASAAGLAADVSTVAAAWEREETRTGPSALIQGALENFFPE